MIMKKNKLTRRQFVTRTMSVGAGIILGRAAFAGTPESTVASKAIRQVMLGKTSLKTTFLGMGTGFSGGNRSSNITRAGVAEAVIRSAYEKGIRFFDCADSYGTHPFTKSALKDFPVKAIHLH
jgi:hypothetical protein